MDRGGRNFNLGGVGGKQGLKTAEKLMRSCERRRLFHERLKGNGEGQGRFGEEGRFVPGAAWGYEWGP